MDIKKYWTDVAADEPHGYETYAGHTDAELDEVFDALLRLCPPNARLLEVGSNTGTNLDYLRRKGGFSAFTAVEINGRAIDNFRKIYPETFAMTQAIVGDALPTLRGLPSASYDVVFSRGCLINIPYEDDAIFAEMHRLSRNIVIIMEAEALKKGSVLFPRDYDKIFKDLGYQLILKKLLIGAKWGFVPPDPAKLPWLRIYIRESVVPRPAL